MPKKLTQEEAAKRFADAGGELCGPYQGSNKRSLCRCTCGDLMEMTLDSFVRGYRCPNCARKVASEKLSNTRKGEIRSQEHIAAKLQEQGCELLSEYRGATEKFQYRCQCGAVGEKTWLAFKRSYRCQECGKRSQKYTLEEARELCQSQGKELLETSYKDNREKIRVRCNCGEEYITTLSSIQCGKSCIKCGAFKRTKIYAWQSLKSHLAQE